MASPPRREASGDRFEQPSFMRGAFVKSRPAEKARAQFGIPADVVSSTHLVLEKSRQQQALSARRFHHRAVMQEGCVGHKMVEHCAEIRGNRHIDGGVCGDLDVVRQYARVVEQFLSIDGGLGDALQAKNKELQCLPTIYRE